jgi:probable rRNA maturation factor
MALTLSMLVEGGGWEAEGDLEPVTEKILAKAQALCGVALMEGAEVSVLLCDDARIREINHEWRGLDKPTNVLSFPAAPKDALARSPLVGDIAVAFETVCREAADEGKSLGDHYAHMITHGFLHLVGYDHETDEEAEQMEALEIRILGELGIPDPYASGELDLRER